jgi:glycosyltransferase involved in cell wall biosynthesis
MKKMKISIGIHVNSDPQRLQTTIESLKANTRQSVEILVFPDGPDRATREYLSTLTYLPQSSTTESRGAPYCFNRLLTGTDADLYMFLESGVQFGMDWIDYLLFALNADPRHGLVGPSTNRAWNEQGVFPSAGGSPAEIARTATLAAQRFGHTWRTLEPLHNLADFCYAVKREVVQAIGAADEGYGSGPCWEMDYNIRAARAGYLGVWACGAYVHRAPFTSRRRREEIQHFEANKRRYQNKFCALHLRQERKTYETHCRGETCEHFAPVPLIQLYLPLSPPQEIPPRQKHPLPEIFPDPKTESPEMPLVSCILPTRDRVRFALRAIHYFQQQDYPMRELLILDDSLQDWSGQIPADPRIRYIRVARGISIGAKRNQACALAQGPIIAHWDDDDWHAPHRLRYQVEALHRANVEVCGINQVLFYDKVSKKAWQYTYPPNQRFWLSGSTLCYQRTYWKKHRFPDINIGEDARFVWSGSKEQMLVLSDSNFHVSIIHSQNVSPKNTQGAYWHPYPQEKIKQLLDSDWDFYEPG